MTADGFGEAGSEQHGVGPNAELEVDLALNGWNKVRQNGRVRQK